MVNGPQWAFSLVPSTHLQSPASSALQFSVQVPEGLSQLEWTRLTEARLFAFLSSSFGFSFKLFPSFPSCWISCSVVFLSLSSDSFPFAFIFLHTHTLHFSYFLLCSYHFEILETLPLQFPRFRQKWSSEKPPLLDSAVLNTGEH